MTAAPTLTAELRAEVLHLENDLRARVASQPDVDADWRETHRKALKHGRTATPWEEWRDERVTQVAVAWVLGTVFVRFLEDNELIDRTWISGRGHRRTEALDAQREFMRLSARGNRDVTEREWLLEALKYLANLKASPGLVDITSLTWVTPSGDAAMRLLAFWRETNEDGHLLRDLTDPELDTRFLGDLYQDLSEAARARFALLQTPVFVEEFILDRTMKEALKQTSLEEFRLIDPTCGSGHFLLGAFDRLLERWHQEAPKMDERARVKMVLDALHGVDLNWSAILIARFRLTVAAFKAAGAKSLDDPIGFRFHLVAGDSLLHGLDQGEFDLGEEHSQDRTTSFSNARERLDDLRRILENGRYNCVVGNPPYITVKDQARNSAYRENYNYLKGTYALTVPFMERFFNLAKTGERPGWVGQITSNSFMKREFGAPLIEKFFPKIDLTLVVDTSGAYIPGHGTPTVILVGRNRPPVAETVRAVLGIRGEPGRPDDAANGKVWTAITEHVDEPGWSDEWVTVTDLKRASLSTHPWSLSGGGAAQLASVLTQGREPLTRRTQSLGYTGQTNADEAFLFSERTLRRQSVNNKNWRPFLTGEEVRDYRATPAKLAIFPYEDGKLRPLTQIPTVQRWMWANRTLLWARATFGKSTYRGEGRTWWEWHQIAKSRLSGAVLTWAFVQTHNHFVYLPKVLLHNRSAPVIQLPERASEDDHLALLGVLNSSTACFWLKQNSHDKGNGGIGGGIGDEKWEPRYEFTGTTLQDYPLPEDLPLQRGQALDALAQRLTAATPEFVCDHEAASRSTLEEARRTYEATRAEMIAQHEELDWEVYRLYGLIDDDLTYLGDDLSGLTLGERAFEIVLARRVVAGEEETAWFARHGSRPITEIPSHWPAAYRELVQRRIDAIESQPFIRLLERPEHKRRWASEPWEKQEQRALRNWLLDRLEDKRFWFDNAGRPTPRSVAQLADDVARDHGLASVLALWEGRPDVPVTASLQRLLAEEAVPYLATYRYKDSGLRKRAAWEQTWRLQRLEDAGQKLDAPIPVPPKYTSADFVRKEYWAHRGKLDVPKERFVLYPDAGRETDPTPVLGWAGWDHAQQALALATLIQQREADGWADDRLVPLVAGLAELQPWVEQWHAEPDPFYGGVSPAEFFREQLGQKAHQVGRTLDQLGEWRPSPARRGRKARLPSTR